jgi:TPR repeat protein
LAKIKSKQKPLWLRTLKKKAHSGDSHAQYMLGVVFATGEKGLPISNRQALRWYRLASDRGFAPAQYNLGTIGLLWLRRAAKKGSSDAQILLGGIYRSGLFGIRRNGSLATKWYSAAIKGGQYRAECELALMYLEGEGVAKNAKKGIRLLRSSDRHGYTQAKEHLAKYNARSQTKISDLNGLRANRGHGRRRRTKKIAKPNLQGGGVTHYD